MNRATGKAIGSRGQWGTIDIVKTAELMEFLGELAPNVADAAYSALSDFSENGHRAYDPQLRRAYCFERQGLEFHYHWWEDVPSQEIAGKLFDVVLRTRLPFKDEYSDNVYRAALSGHRSRASNCASGELTAGGVSAASASACSRVDAR